MINNTVFPVLNISMLPGTDSNNSLLNFGWECETFTKLYMDVRLNFKFYD